MDAVHDVPNPTTGLDLHPEDIEDQQEDNYTYDEIGNLSKDLVEEIERIEWTVSGKVYAVIRKANSGKANLYFSYDAMGNRISKKSVDALGNTKTTYYFRDASGNTMTTYEKRSTSTFTPSEYHIYGSSRLGMYSPTRPRLSVTETRMCEKGV